MYRCFFSLNDPFEIFETQILHLEESLTEAIGLFLISSDFNSKSPMGFLAFKIVTKRLVIKRNTPGLDNPDRVKYILQSLFPHIEPFQRQDRNSCMVRCEKLLTLKDLMGASGRLKANTAPRIDGVPSEIPKEVIRAYLEILLGAFNSFLREGRFFLDW